MIAIATDITARVRKGFRSFYSVCQPLIARGLRNSQYAYKEKLISYLQPNIVMLDLGCGHQLLPDWMPHWEEEQRAILNMPRLLVGIDGDLSSLEKYGSLSSKILGDIHQLPLRSNSFDVVAANVVVEHVADPARLLLEIRRVLKPGGVFLFHTPNFWGYATLANSVLPNAVRLRLVHWLQARKAEDVFPTHYRLNTRRAIRSIAKQTGLDVAELEMVESSAQTVMLGPVVILELLWIAFLRFAFMGNFRTNIIAVLRKSCEGSGSASYGGGATHR